MGRKPSKNLNLPAGLRARVKTSGKIYYYFDTGGKPRREIPLGPDYVLAIKEWSRLAADTSRPIETTVAWAIGKYLASHDYSAVSAGTQADYKFALDQIEAHFGSAPLDQVRPSHIVLYIEKRSAESAHRAQRERAVFSMLYRWCQERDWCPTNPAATVRGRKLPGRKAIDITDALFDAVYAAACQPLKDAMDLAYLIGQRPADVLKLSETDIRDGILALRQNKTGAPIRLRVEGALADLVARIEERKRGYPVRALALLIDDRGRPMTKAKLRGRFEAARTAAGIAGDDFHFRDLRRKAAHDMRDQEGIEAAQGLLGHASVVMTEHYAGSGKIRSAIPRLPSKDGA